jgi:Trm5-related predicted tRNA methylase
MDNFEQHYLGLSGIQTEMRHKKDQIKSLLEIVRSILSDSHLVATDTNSIQISTLANVADSRRTSQLTKLVAVITVVYLPLTLDMV